MKKIIIGKSIQEIKAAEDAVKKDFQAIVQIELLNHFKDSFINEGFTDEVLQKWKPRKSNEEVGRAILTQSHDLQGGIKVISSTPERITVGVNQNEVPYAAIHNTGGTITVTITPQMRKFFWYKYKETHDAKYKAMALTKKTSLHITIPKRQFIGASRKLDQKVANKFNKLLTKALS